MFCMVAHLISLVVIASICDNHPLLLILLAVGKGVELHQPDLGQPGVLTLALQGSGSRPWLVRVEVGRRQRQQAKG